MPENKIAGKNRDEFRDWLLANSGKEKECWVVIKRGKPTDDEHFWYLDVVEETDIRAAGVWEQFIKFPDLYQRIRAYNLSITNSKNFPDTVYQF